MLILKAHIFEQFPEIVFGSSTKIGLNRIKPFYFNLSLSVGDKEDIVWENRKTFFENLGFGLDKVVLQNQVHSNIVTYVKEGDNLDESDAMITDKLGIGLAVSTADCTPIYIYDKQNKVIAAVHSGWRGTVQNILYKTLMKLESEFNSSPENMFAYVGPSISQMNYEVGSEVAEQFEEKYLLPKSEKYLLDVGRVNYDILVDYDIPRVNIQKSNLCTYQMNNLLHSYRRDGKTSGRSLGVIAMK